MSKLEIDALTWAELNQLLDSALAAALWLGRCHQALGHQAASREALSRAAHLVATTNSIQIPIN